MAIHRRPLRQSCRPNRPPLRHRPRRPEAPDNWPRRSDSPQSSDQQWPHRPCLPPIRRGRCLLRQHCSRVA
ncbi:hypothetical protein CUMW_096540 [Citrus unshiu]|uniref:Uncharacterized protein n=1 Tax=Citrus unshiu TaxID=55188 RepID=A0A2H5P2Q5_CITUN|nr:hypothetical protein CUMW_096540 [Citrus unshiu]